MGYRGLFPDRHGGTCNPSRTGPQTNINSCPGVQHCWNVARDRLDNTFLSRSLFTTSTTPLCDNSYFYKHMVKIVYGKGSLLHFFNLRVTSIPLTFSNKDIFYLLCKKYNLVPSVIHHSPSHVYAVPGSAACQPYTPI